jgi:hypothetical protein
MSFRRGSPSRSSLAPRPLSSPVAAFFACAALATPAYADDISRFAGKSIKVDWVTATMFKRTPDGAVGRSSNENRGLHLYIGKSGHVFQYGGFKDYWSKAVQEVGRARDGYPGHMIAFSIQGSRLTRIVKLISGFWALNVDLSADGKSCSMTDGYTPGADGNIIGFDPYTNAPFYQVSRVTESSSCAVLPGNIFAADE